VGLQQSWRRTVHYFVCWKVRQQVCLCGVAINSRSSTADMLFGLALETFQATSRPHCNCDPRAGRGRQTLGHWDMVTSTRQSREQGW
jgi:hypothetical protein